MVLGSYRWRILFSDVNIDVWYGYTWCNYSFHNNNGHFITGNEYRYFVNQHTSQPSAYITVFSGGHHYSAWCHVSWVNRLTSTRTITTEVCQPGPLDITSRLYEFNSCNQYQRRGVITWEAKPTATNYKLQRKVGSNWYTYSNGSDVAHMHEPLTGGSYNYRVRASNSSDTGDWYNFKIFVPDCPPGGGGVIPH